MYTESALEGFLHVHTSLENGLFATMRQGMYTKTTIELSFAVHTRYVPPPGVHIRDVLHVLHIRGMYTP